MKIKEKSVLHNVRNKQSNANNEVKQTTDFIDFEKGKMNISVSKTIMNISEGELFFIHFNFSQ